VPFANQGPLLIEVLGSPELDNLNLPDTGEGNPLPDKPPYKTIGKNEMTVPRHYYKVILDYAEPDFKAIGFVLPNEGSDGRLEGFATTVNERYQYPRTSPGSRRRCLLFRPKGCFISPCFPLPRSVMGPW